MLGDKPFKLRHKRGMSSHRELGIDALLDGSEVKLLESLDVKAHERLELEVCEWSPPPQRLGFTQRHRRAFRITALKSAAPLREVPLEDAEVELLGLDAEQVAGGLRNEAGLGAARRKRLPEA
jgi:hypothetical protein